ncbi:flagellar assembly peptidoglycan hydrolase FlgJ [Variovorax sp. VNK109]|jgi:flagellar protein FlgJ|uniref:flagellar assembly peptidoglycan hydrolase FlgJ n=1 Tax=Variovorax sp. VNK109 TaxID=3400919 RepID=UPI003BFC4199
MSSASFASINAQLGSMGATSGGLAADGRSLNALKLAASQDDPKAIKEAAKQFESLFMRELIKSMREATMKSGLLDSSAGDLSTDMLDQQLSVTMSGLPGGLSDAIAQQLSRQIVRPNNLPGTNGMSNGMSITPTISLPQVTPSGDGANVSPSERQSDFVQKHSAAAQRVQQQSGIPASFMIGQAGHETGWGRGEIRNSDGSNSFNLFGIKAGGSWTGKVAEITTTEYVDGEPRKVTAKFRAYDSYEDSFRDYARLINESPRYAQARQQTGSVHAYANELQRAGYATDPAYASKLSRAINATLQAQRTQA